VSLYADRQAIEIRPTDDVDIVVEITTRNEYTKLEEQLRTMGFKNDVTAKFVGRYLLPGIVVDVMPTNESILGFSNIWYEGGFKNAVDYVIDNQHTVKIFSAPYFIASKLQAFKNRGNNDGRLSTDFEDITFVLDNRNTIWEEMKSADDEVRKFLLEEFNHLLNHKYIEEWIGAHVGYGSTPSTDIILEEIRKFIE
jgi:predicted nucleotidyltransferase